MSRQFITALILWTVLLPAGVARRAEACPFCSAVTPTFGDRIASADMAVIGRLVELPGQSVEPTAASARARFDVIDVLKGGRLLREPRVVRTFFFGQGTKGELFLLLGSNDPTPKWSVPIRVSERARAYVLESLKAPEKGPDRLAFFQEYLEDEDWTASSDAYGEFSKAPYADLVAMKDKINHDRIVAWIKDPSVSGQGRRLYLTMLGVCGSPDDAAMVEQMLKLSKRDVNSSPDALIACYLTLRGPSGMRLVDDLFIRNKDAEYSDTYAAITALRFHAEQADVIPRPRILESIHLMLDRPELADLVIVDLARWEDWSVMPRLVRLFKEADEQSDWVRVPVLRFLMACPLPAAKGHLKELSRIDSKALKQAQALSPFLGAATPGEMGGGPSTNGPDGKGFKSRKTSTGAPPKSVVWDLFLIAGVPLLVGATLVLALLYFLRSPGKAAREGETYDEDGADEPYDDDEEDYRSLSVACVGTLVVGLMSLAAIVFPALLIIPLVGMVLGLFALWRVRRNAEFLAGTGLAAAGMVLSAVLFTGAGAKHLVFPAIEVPKDYELISFWDLQPDDNHPELPIPPSALELDGRRVFVKGFVFPHKRRKGLKQFVLVPDAKRCCFGGQPKLHDMIEVTLRDPLRIDFSYRYRGIGGTFKVHKELQQKRELQGVYYELDADCVH